MLVSSSEVFSQYPAPLKDHSCILKFFSEANCNARFGICEDIVSYLCNCLTKWHQILDASLSNNPKVACRKKFI